MNDELFKLKDRIHLLEQENLCLRTMLSEAGIQYTPMPGLPSYSAAPEVLERTITDKMANRFFSYFWGRQDVYAKRSVSKKTGASGYYPQCVNFWSFSCPRRNGQKTKCMECGNRLWKKLEIKTIRKHLEGNAPDGSDVIGVYPLLPDETSRFLVFDFDNHQSEEEKENHPDKQWREEVDTLRLICKQNGIAALTERSRSGNGAHLWIFFDQPVQASLARQFGYALLEKGAESVNLKSFRYYDRMLPAQDHLPKGGLGNLIALPLQGQVLKQGNSAFVDEDWNAYPDQWNVLFHQPKLSIDVVEQYLTKWRGGMIVHNGNDVERNEPEKPWERTKHFHAEDVADNIKITLADGIYVDTSNLKPRIQNQIRRMAAFSNPKFYRNQAMGISNYKYSRFIYLGEDIDGYIHLPQGLWDKVRDQCQNDYVGYEVDDQRVGSTGIDVTFRGTLRESQIPAVEAMLQHENGILSAATAFGKTVVCTKLIAERRERTLILLESSALIEQWQKAVETFLTINEELPLYKTKTGRTKRRKSAVGWLQGAHNSLTGIVDIAMVGSLCKNGEYHSKLQDYGMVIVDECHHAASDTVVKVLQKVRAKYVYGVTATPMRGDGLEKINYMLIGPIRYRYSAKERAKEQGIRHLVCPRFTRTVNPYRYGEKMHPNEAYELLRKNDSRDDQILEDVKQCVRQGRTPVILTKYTDHAKKLHEKLNGEADHVFLFLGTTSKKAQRTLREQLESVKETESVILVATGQLIGEGFDYPRLDTLFLATPVAWKGVVEQYAGRLNRDYEGKESAMIYDYVDSHIPMFERMYGKRLRAYKQIGYEIFSLTGEHTQQINTIYGMDNYSETYLNDLKSACDEIVISSQTLNYRKVYQLIDIAKDRQAAGVKVTIVTWHPDVYLYGKSEKRMELLEQLRKAGFHILTVEDNCEHYAVIDREVVWYGSMNLLSKEDADDNLMRICDKTVAAELLEMTFGSAKELSNW